MSGAEEKHGKGANRRRERSGGPAGGHAGGRQENDVKLRVPPLPKSVFSTPPSYRVPHPPRRNDGDISTTDGGPFGRPNQTKGWTKGGTVLNIRLIFRCRGGPDTAREYRAPRQDASKRTKRNGRANRDACRHAIPPSPVPHVRLVPRSAPAWEPQVRRAPETNDSSKPGKAGR